MAGFLFSPNLGLPEIQSYLFDLFVLSFQWLLLVPICLGTAQCRHRLVVCAGRGSGCAICASSGPWP